MTKEYDVMCAGHLCLDLTPRFPDTGAKSLGELLVPGGCTNVHEARISTGGAVSNTGICMKILGNRVCFSARVGDDTFGRLIVERMQEHGSTDGIRVVAGVASSYSVVLAPPRLDRCFIHNPGTNDTFCADDVSAELVAQCRHFHFGYPQLMQGMFEDRGATLERLFRTARAAGATTSLDMTLADPEADAGKADWQRILERVLPHVDLFVPSVEESLYSFEPARFRAIRAEHPDEDLLGCLDIEAYRRLAAHALELGCRIAILKGGSRGIYLRTRSASELSDTAPGHDVRAWGSREIWCPAFIAPEVLAATGAGDAAVGGFLTGWLKGLPPARALKIANCLGWQNVQALDAVSGLKPWHETLALLEQGIPLADSSELLTKAWRWAAKPGVWFGPHDTAETP